MSLYIKQPSEQPSPATVSGMSQQANLSVQARQRSRQQAIDQNQAIARSVAPYNLGDGQYDITMAVAEKKVPRETLIQAFGEQAVNQQEILVNRSVYLPATKEWIAKEEFNRLTPQQQELIRSVGINSFNAQERARIETENRAIQAQNTSNQVAYDKAVAEQQAILDKLSSYSEGNNSYRFVDAVVDKVISPDDVYKVADITDKASFQGEVDKAIRNKQVMQVLNIAYKTPDGYDLWELVKDQIKGKVKYKISKTDLVNAGFNEADIPNGNEVAKELNSEYKAEHPRLTPTQQKIQFVAKTYLDFTVPGYATQRHWSELGKGVHIGSKKVVSGGAAQAVSIGLDALAVIPMIGAAGAGARSFSIATRAGTATTAKVGRAIDAVIGIKVIRPSGIKPEVWKSLSAGQKIIKGNLATGEMWKQMAWAPELLGSATDMFKPVKIATRAGEFTKYATGVRAAGIRTRTMAEATIGRVKATTNTLENLLSPRKLPESTVFLSNSTERLKLSDFDSIAKAMRARDRLTVAAQSTGSSVIVDLGDKYIIMNRSAIMEELGGGLAHATPHGEDYTAGVVVGLIKGKQTDASMFLSPEPLERFALSDSLGNVGKEPAIILLSPETAKKLSESSGKTYKQWAELERTIPPKVEIDTAKFQKLYTRTGVTGKRINIYLEKPLTNTQILSLKSKGLIKSIENFYKPAITITGKTGKVLDAGEMKGLAEVVKETDPAVAKNLRLIADDPEGVYRTLQKIASPDIYRVKVSNRTGTPRVYTERVEPRRGESPVDTYRRVAKERDVSVRRVADSVERIARSGDVSRLTGLSRTDIGRTSGTSRTDTILSRNISNRDIPRGNRSTRTGIVKTSTRFIPLLLSGAEKSVRDIRRVPRGSIAWPQGQIRQGDKLVDQWWVWIPPYEPQSEYLFSMPKAPEGARRVSGLKSAYETIRLLKGKTAPEKLATAPGRLGVVNLEITKGRKAKYTSRSTATTGIVR